MIKRGVTLLLLTTAVLLSIPFTAYADALIEPDNDFYNQHRSQCVYLGRSFYANGADGFIPVKKDPGSKSEMGTIQNGEVTYIECSCLYGGDYWGFTFGHSGWIQMDQLLVLYDYVAFEEEHLGELYPYSGDYDEIKKNASAIAWPWPGSETLLWTFEDLDTTNFWVSHAYTDGQGREWGFVTYLYGSRNIWICLSDPLNRDIPVFNPTPKPMPWVSETAHTDIGKTETPFLAVVIILVAALASGTVVIIRVLWKPNESKQGGKKHD